MVRKGTLGALALAGFAAIVTAIGIVSSGTRTKNLSTTRRLGDIPDLIVVADRLSGDTTAYTLSQSGTWGNIPDLVVTARRSGAAPSREVTVKPAPAGTKPL